MALRAAAVIPVFNGLPDVLEAVASALAQTLPPVEVVVVDDRSTDGSGDAVEAQFGSSGVVRVLRGSFGSASAARNAGIREARAPWVAFLDADDLWYPEKLATASEAIDAVPSAGWFFSDGAFRAVDGTMSASWFDLCADLQEPYAGHPVGELFDVNFVLTSSVVARRELLVQLGGFDQDLSHSEDLDLWIRLARHAPATASHRRLVRYQNSAGGLSSQVGSRLWGNVVVFRRLAKDVSLGPELRRRARRRESLAHYKLGFAALRAGDGPQARRHLRGAWMFPERAVQVVGLWLASWLPASWLGRVRTQRWATRGIAGRTLAHPRVRLRSEPGLFTVQGGRA